MSAERGAEGGPDPAPDDLDALAAQPSEAPASPEGTDGPPRRRGAALVAALAVAALLGAGTGSFVTSRHERAAARDAGAVLGLQAGFPSLVSGTDPGTGDAQGWAPITVSLPLSNRGSEEVTVSVLGLDARGQRADGPPPKVVVPAGATVPALLGLVVECAEHPPVSRAATRADRTEARVEVPLPTGERTADLPLAQPPGRSFDGLLSFACRPAAERTALQDARWVPLADGRLRVTVNNTYYPDPLTLELRETPGLGVSSDTPLPMTIPPREVGELTLSIEPRCSALRRGEDQPSSTTFSLVTVADDVVQATIADDGDAGRVRWLARRLALACG